MGDKTMPVSEAKDILGQRVDAAHYGDEFTVITKSGQNRAVVVSWEWYRQAESRRRELLGQPGAASGAELDPLPSDTIRHGGHESTG